MDFLKNIIFIELEFVIQICHLKFSTTIIDTSLSSAFSVFMSLG